MISFVQNGLPVATIVAHAILVFAFSAIFFRRSCGGRVTSWLGKNSTNLAFVVSLSAVLGSLFYSNIVGFPPCELCWWQRVFLFPIPVLIGVALWKKIHSVFFFVVPLAVIASVIALYHSYVNLGGVSLLPCTAVGAECSKLYVMSFGYITIPMMSLTIALYILLLAWARKIYDQDNNA